MTYFADEVARLNKELHSKGYLLKQIIRAKQFIDKNYSEPISINDFAREAALSKFHFQRLFKEKYGRTVNNYLQEVRIVQAKKLLKKRMTVTEVCEAVGFESLPTFSRLFKTITGITPSQFQKKHF